MSWVPRNTIEHFTHPEHRLILEVESKTEYLCNGCKTIGDGTRYRCDEGCNFYLHDYCATCPTTLSSYMHPQHQLTLVVRKPQAMCQLNRICDLCRDPVEGLFYRCKVCDFDVHPLCTQFPEKLRHALDTCHHLELRKWSSGSCAVCGDGCTSWRYGCVTCGLDIHIQCVLLPLAPLGAHSSVPPLASSSTDRGIPGFGTSRSHWPPHPTHCPPPSTHYPTFYPPPPHYPPPGPPPPPQYYHGYGYGVSIPYHCPINPYNNNMYNSNHAQTSVGPTGGLGKKVFAVLGKITLGVISSAIFGAVF